MWEFFPNRQHKIMYFQSGARRVLCVVQWVYLHRKCLDTTSWKCSVRFLYSPSFFLWSSYFLFVPKYNHSQKANIFILWYIPRTIVSVFIETMLKISSFIHCCIWLIYSKRWAHNVYEMFENTCILFVPPALIWETPPTGHHWRLPPLFTAQCATPSSCFSTALLQPYCATPLCWPTAASQLLLSNFAVRFAKTVGQSSALGQMHIVHPFREMGRCVLGHEHQFMKTRSSTLNHSRGCSHITSAKIRGSWTPPLPPTMKQSWTFSKSKVVQMQRNAKICKNIVLLEV